MPVVLPMTAPLRFRRLLLELQAIRNTDQDAAQAIVRWIKEASTDVLDVEVFNSGLLTIYSIDRPPMECERGDWMVLDRDRFVPWTDAAINDLAEPADPFHDLGDPRSWVNPVEVH